MTLNQFEVLSSDLQSLARIIPLKWGVIQNDAIDKQVDMFSLDSYNALENKIAQMDEGTKNYFVRRWFLWQCAQCDEYLFCCNKNVKPNPNSRDQSYDIAFFEDLKLRFDLKGTVIPKPFRSNIQAVLTNPQAMIDFFYEKQSTGVRNHIQNRLFIVHHSFKQQEREMFLRSHWEFKKQVYEEVVEVIQQKKEYYQYKNVRVLVLFLLEKLDGNFEYRLM
jgi:hypothetical protein